MKPSELKYDSNLQVKLSNAIFSNTTGRTSKPNWYLHIAKQNDHPTFNCIVLHQAKMPIIRQNQIPFVHPDFLNRELNYILSFWIVNLWKAHTAVWMIIALQDIAFVSYPELEYTCMCAIPPWLWCHVEMKINDKNLHVLQLNVPQPLVKNINKYLKDFLNLFLAST